ncbi:MAG: aldehyde dehydrogenase family protein, partial [Methanobacteriota archaeon]
MEGDARPTEGRAPPRGRSDLSAEEGGPRPPRDDRDGEGDRGGPRGCSGGHRLLRMFGNTVPSELPDKMCMTIRLPVGLVGLITPWNFPMAIPAWKSGAALIAGCPMVLKPSSLTPLCGANFVEVLDEAGFPPGVVNMLTGNGSVVGDGIVGHPDIRAVSFTGGVDTGKHVYEAAAKKMIKVGLELGGKNAILAMADAPLDLLMDGVMFGAFGTAGQRCTAA